MKRTRRRRTPGRTNEALWHRVNYAIDREGSRCPANWCFDVGAPWGSPEEARDMARQIFGGGIPLEMDGPVRAWVYALDALVGDS